MPDSCVCDVDGLDLALDLLAERIDRKGRLVSAEYHVPPHEQVAKVEDETLVVHMVVRSSAEAEGAEKRVPWVLNLTVYQGQPTAEHSAKSHVRPHVTMHQLCCDGEGKENHADGVGDRAIKCIEHLR